MAGFLYGGISIYDWIAGNARWQKHEKMQKAMESAAAAPAPAPAGNA